MADTDRSVAGHCPMGCGQTLFVGDGGCLTCAYSGCPNPSAVDEILRDRETEHIVHVGEQGWTARHPLRERLGDELMTCKLDEWMSRLSGPPGVVGRYRVVEMGEDWSWQPLEGKD